MKEKVKKMIIMRETLVPLKERVITPHVVAQVYEHNPAILPLSLIKFAFMCREYISDVFRNYIDRITEVEANDYVVPNRLKGHLIGMESN